MHENCRSSIAGHQNMFSTRDYFEPCPHGTHNTGGSTLMCSPCPAGRSCLRKGASTLCVLPQYSLLGEIHCHDCPVGSSCTITATTPCTTGKYSGYGVATCSDCPTGSYCPDIFQDALLCPPGTFQDATDQVGCKACLIGTYSSEFGATNCIDCPAGSYCPYADQACYCLSLRYLLSIRLKYLLYVYRWI